MSDETIINFHPGSPAAVERGCSCPVLDNSHGQGIFGGEVKDVEGHPLFWINAKCPLHGTRASWPDSLG